MVIENFDIVFYTCIFLVPGFIIKSIMDMLVPPAKHNEQKYFLSCLLYSIVTLGVFSGVYQLIHTYIDNDSKPYWFLLSLTTVVGSIILAILIGKLRQNNAIDKLCEKIKLNKSKSIPTAWDYCFSKQKEAYVIVTLDDDSIIYGKYSGNSFSSSESEERDLFIEEIYTINEKEEWILSEKCNGILIAKDRIKTIEIINAEECL